MSNLISLASRFDPQYAMRTRELEQKIYSQYELARYNADSAMEREHVKGGYELNRQVKRDEAAFEREAFKEDRADLRQEREISGQASLEQARGANSIALSKFEHENLLSRMEDDLLNHLTKAGGDSGILATHKIIDEDVSRRQSLMRQMEARTQLRGEVFKMIAGAVIQEKLAQKQHLRDMERIQKDSENRRADAYIANVSQYLTLLLDKGREQEARQEVDRLVAEWGRSG